jgi:hypothetical protein
MRALSAARHIARVREPGFSDIMPTRQWALPTHARCTTHHALRRRPPGRRDLVGMLANRHGADHGLCRSGKYQFYNCEQLAGQRSYWAGRELELPEAPLCARRRIRRLDAVALHRVRQRESQELARHSGQLARSWRVSEAPFSGFWTTFNPCRASVSGVQFSISVLMMPETRFESAETGSN